MGDRVLVGLIGLRGGDPCVDDPEHDRLLEGGLFTGRQASCWLEVDILESSCWVQMVLRVILSWGT